MFIMIQSVLHSSASDNGNAKHNRNVSAIDVRFRQTKEHFVVEKCTLSLLMENNGCHQE